MFGLNIHVLIVSVFPLKVLYNTGSENLDWGRGLDVIFFISLFKFMFNFFKNS